MKLATVSIVVLTLNVAGPRRVHQGWPSRREALVAQLGAERSDAAAYQELWRGEDVETLGEASGHAQRAADPALGLAVTSRLPLVSSSSRDLGNGGGVLRARLRMDDKVFDVYSVRLTPGEGAAEARRLGQMFRLSEFVRAQSSTVPFVLLGDLAESADEREASLMLDLLEARDLCVSHGDEVCGRTLGDHRVDYALIPYSSREPKEHARTAFTALPVAEDDDGAPAGLHFGLRAALDARFLTVKPATAPSARDEALGVIADALETARADAERRSQGSGWIPFLDARSVAAARDETARFLALEEEVHSARMRSTVRESPTPTE